MKGFLLKLEGMVLGRKALESGTIIPTLVYSFILLLIIVIIIIIIYET